MNISKVKELLFMALEELEKLESKPAPLTQLPMDKIKQKAKMHLYDAYAKGIIDKDTLESEIKNSIKTSHRLYTKNQERLQSLSFSL